MMMPSARDILAIVRNVDDEAAADLIETYGKTVASYAAVEATERAFERALQILAPRGTIQ